MRHRLRQAAPPPWGTVLTAATALALALAQLRWPHADWLSNWGLVPQQFWLADQWSRFSRPVTALFVHNDWVHLGGNLVFFFLFARPVEGTVGGIRLLGLFLAAGAIANVFAAWRLSESSAAIIGMSGAVSALLGAYLVLYPRARIGVILPLGLYWQMIRAPALALIGSWFALQLLYTFLSAGVGAVAWWTHIAGFLLGSVIAFPLRSYRQGRALKHRYHG